jgi:hypothetical protein
VETIVIGESAAAEAPAGFSKLEAKAARASICTILECGSGMGLRVVSSLVLKRLPLPAIFGGLNPALGYKARAERGAISARGRANFLNPAWTIQ